MAWLGKININHFCWVKLYKYMKQLSSYVIVLTFIENAWFQEHGSDIQDCHEGWVVIKKEDGTVVVGHCSCMAG